MGRAGTGGRVGVLLESIGLCGSSRGRAAVGVAGVMMACRAMGRAGSGRGLGKAKDTGDATGV